MATDLHRIELPQHHGHGALIRGAIVASLGGFLLGFDSVVISGANDALKDVFELKPFAQGFTVAIAMLGTIAGALLIGKPADIWGRKPALLALAIGYFISPIACAFAGDWHQFLVARFIGGLAIGGASAVAPMYIAEIAPARLRGRLVAATQLNLVIGILICQLSNYLIKLAVGQHEPWRWMLGVAAIPSVVFFFMIFGIPESPRWLVKVGRPEDAGRSLVALGRTDVTKELAEIETSLADQAGLHSDRLFQRAYRRPIFLAAAIAVFNQFTGINAILYYAPSILQQTGDDATVALLKSSATGATLLVFTIVAMAAIDRVGRRLMLIGSIGMTICLALAAWEIHLRDVGQSAPLLLPALIGHIAFFACSQGAIIWVFISEIFPNAVRAKGQMLGWFTHWLIATPIVMFFPQIDEAKYGGWAFAVFAAAMALQFFFALWFMPETKGRTLEEIGTRLASAGPD